MSSKRMAIIAGSVLGGGLLIGAVALRWPTMVGWVAFIGFALTGIAALLGFVGVARRRTSIAFGVYMLACAVHFGIGFGETGLPRWVRLATTALMLLSVAWLAREAQQDAGGGPRVV